MAEPSATLEDGRMRNEKISHVDGLSSAQTMRPYIDQERPTEAAQEKIGPTQNTEDPASRTKSNGQAASPPTQGSDPQLLTPSRLHGILLKLAALSTLGIFSFFGVLVRLGLSAIGDYSGRSTFPLLWAQVVGCLIMGAVSERRELIEGVYIPLYVGISTGLCGSITTFSGWMAGVFEAWINLERHPHGGFYNSMDGLGQSVFTLSACIGAFIFGTHLADCLFPPFLKHLHYDSRHPQSRETQKEQTSVPRPRPYPHWIHLSVIALFIGMWLASVLVCAYVPRWRGIVSFSLVFSPIGTWLRFYLSQLNPRYPRFPLGTFAANAFGTFILAGMVAAQYYDSGLRAGSPVACQALQGISDGFCGCLTTVSTFVVEIRKLRRRDCYIYVLTSWTVGQLAMLVILGSTDFSKGIGAANKCTIK